MSEYFSCFLFSPVGLLVLLVICIQVGLRNHFVFEWFSCHYSCRLTRLNMMVGSIAHNDVGRAERKGLR